MMNPVFKLNVECEHCGKLEPYTLVFDNGCCTWCRSCAPEIDGWEEITDVKLAESFKMENEAKIKHFTERLKYLKEDAILIDSELEYELKKED